MFGDYHNLYLLTDMLLLADTIESVQDIALRVYRIEPCNFYTLHGFVLVRDVENDGSTFGAVNECRSISVPVFA